MLYSKFNKPRQEKYQAKYQAFVANPKVRKMLEQQRLKDPKLQLVKEARKTEFEKQSRGADVLSELKHGELFEEAFCRVQQNRQIIESELETQEESIMDRMAQRRQLSINRSFNSFNLQNSSFLNTSNESAFKNFNPK